MKIEYKILNDRVTPEMVKPSTEGSAGIDLRAVTGPYGQFPWKHRLMPNEIMRVWTGIAIHISDPGYAAMILPRSGLGTKGLVIGNLVGLIDSDYQGELSITLWNRSEDAIVVNQMDRVAQLVIVPVMRPEFSLVKKFSSGTERGDGGFGSTGVS